MGFPSTPHPDRLTFEQRAAMFAKSLNDMRFVSPSPDGDVDGPMVEDALIASQMMLSVGTRSLATVCEYDRRYREQPLVQQMHDEMDESAFMLAAASASLRRARHEIEHLREQVRSAEEAA